MKLPPYLEGSEKLILNLTQKVADRFGIDFRSLEVRQGDFWRVDIVILNRFKYLLCVHEPTLFTHILLAKKFRSTEDIFLYLTGKYPFMIGPLTLGKSANSRVTGSVNEMKKEMSALFRYGVLFEELEDQMNNSIFFYLDCLYPKTAWERYLLKSW